MPGFQSFYRFFTSFFIGQIGHHQHKDQGFGIGIKKNLFKESIRALQLFHVSAEGLDSLRQGLSQDFQTGSPKWSIIKHFRYQLFFKESIRIRDGDRKPETGSTGLSIAVKQSKTGPPSKRFGFLWMHRVPGGVIKLSAPTSSLASQCLPSTTIKQPFQNLSSLVSCPISLCSEAF